MDRRTHEGPMDFEYQNGTGPIDMRSPFAQVSGNQRFFGGQGEDNNNTRKRMGTRSAFGSPSKPSSPIKSFGPNTPFSLKSGPTFVTPASVDVDISMSDAGAPKSPEQSSMMDSDATPDNTAFRSMPATFEPNPTLFGNISPTKLKDKNLERAKSPDKRRDSWWSRAAGLMSSPTNKDELPKAVQPNEKLITKVQKKKRGESLRQLIKLRSNSMSDSEISQSPSPTKSRKRNRWGRRIASDSQAEQAPKKGTIASFFEFISAHPDLPNILSRYTQYALNLTLVTFTVYVIWACYSTMKLDVEKKSTEAINMMIIEVNECERHYIDNKCAPELRVPAMATACANWEKCMARSTANLPKARITVGMWGEMLNSFVEPITWKTMIFSCILIGSVLALSNLPFLYSRSRGEPNISHHYYGNVPPTPHRSLSNPDAQFWTPHQTLQDGAAPTYDGRIEGRGSPTKQLKFR